MSFTMKTYNDSYLYKNKIMNSQRENPDRKANEAIKDFIINSHRISKDDSFRGVMEEVKRNQRSSALYSVLMMDNVCLCIGNSEMPRAFKVFDARDTKSDKQPTVFIDCTGLIELKNGYYNCRKIDVLLAYLFDALIYILYRYYPSKIVDNSAVTINATECYVALFNYIIDHERVVGFSVNKNKISYLVALFFLNNMMGKDLNDYTKNLAATVAKINKADINAYDLYVYDKEDTFQDINTFIKYIVETFKLKGFNIQVFIQKWMYFFGTGTEYASELYTSFLVLIANAYSGSYIVQQRTIENVCKSFMVKTCLEIERAASTASFVNKGFMPTSKFREATEIHDKNSIKLAESIKLRDNAEKYMNINESDFHVEHAAKNISESVIRFCKDSRLEDKISSFAEKAMITGINSAFNSSKDAIMNEEYQLYEHGSLLETAKTLKNYFNDKQRYNIETVINNDIDHLRHLVRESECPKEYVSSVSKVISEMLEVKQYI